MNNKGFGLVGLLIAVLLIALLSGGVFYGYKGGLFGGGTASSTITGPIDAAKKARDLLEKKNQETAQEISKVNDVSTSIITNTSSASGCSISGQRNKESLAKYILLANKLKPDQRYYLMSYYDAQGRRMGDYPDGELVQEIPGGEVDSSSSLTVEDGSVVRIEILGVKNGLGRFTIEKILPNGETKEIVYGALPVVVGMRSTIDVSKSADLSKIYLDINGDGTADITVTPGRYNFKLSEGLDVIRFLIKNEIGDSLICKTLLNLTDRATQALQVNNTGQYVIILREMFDTLYSSKDQISPNTFDPLIILISISIAEPVEVEASSCDANGDKVINQTDIDIIFAALNFLVSSGPFNGVKISDPRDADKDGTVTLSDVNYCVEKCTPVKCEINRSYMPQKPSPSTSL